MSNIQFITGIVVSAILAFLLSPGIFGWVVFLIAGGAAGFLAIQMPRGSERVYWAALLATAALFLISILGANLGRLWVIFPVVLAASYFIARLTLIFQKS